MMNNTNENPSSYENGFLFGGVLTKKMPNYFSIYSSINSAHGVSPQ